jgi:hypothetical protein
MPHVEALVQEIGATVHHRPGRFLKRRGGKGEVAADICLTNLALDLL